MHQLVEVQTKADNSGARSAEEHVWVRGKEQGQLEGSNDWHRNLEDLRIP